MVVALIAHARKNRRPTVRVFARCWNLFQLDGRDPGYDDAWDFVRDECKRQGVYFSPVIFVDNYKEVAKPGGGTEMVPLITIEEQDAWFDKLTTRADVRDPVYLWSIVNEPEQKWQGFKDAVDPRLLRYADLLAERLGHRDFIIGAAPDGDDPDASKDTIEQSVMLAQHCNIVTLHSSRKDGYFPVPGGRWRRWIDHLESFSDVIAACRKVNRRTHGYHEEPPGHASVESVPIPGGVYHREWDPEAALAGALTAEFTGMGYCYHRIRSQDPGTPGLNLIAAVVADVPAGWGYLNDSWAGSPSRGFTDSAGSKVEGKVRHYVRPGGGEARTLAYSNTGVPTVAWANGYTPQVPPLYDGQKVAVWADAAR